METKLMYARYVKYIMLVVGVNLFFVLSSLAQVNSTDIGEKLQSIMKQYKAVGLSVVVVKDNAPVYTQSFGYSNLARKTALQNDAVFRIASISKSFTTVALLKLVEEGRLSLQDDVSDLIGFSVVNPNYPSDKITLQMLLSHTSSLNDSQSYFSLHVLNPETGENHVKCYSDYAPGSRYVYCNLNYNLAGTILEKMHQKRFDLILEEEVLKPMGLSAGYNVSRLDTSRFTPIYLYNDETAAYTHSPAAYRKVETADYKLGVDAFSFSPTGGLKISASDLAKYMRMQMNYGQLDGKRILGETASALMQKSYFKIDAKDDYGLGIKVTRKLVDNEVLVGHTGSAYGLYSAMFFEPNKKFGFVVVTNGCKQIETDGTKSSLLTPVIQALYEAFVKD